MKKSIRGTYNCPTDASRAICCRFLAARPHDMKSLPAQFVLLISHSIQNVIQCNELFYYNVAYVVSQYAVTKKKQKLNTVTLDRLPNTAGMRFLFYAIGSEAGIRRILQAPAPWERLERMLATPAEMPGKGTVKNMSRKILLRWLVVPP